MRKVRALLSPLALVAMLPAAAQCVPDPAHQDADFGVWPDTITNFRSATLGVPYSDTLTLLFPSNAQDIDASLPALLIDSVLFTGVVGLPPGITVDCGTGGPCTFYGGVVGCGLLEGTPTQEGEFPLTINVIAFVNTGASPLPMPYSFTGYRVVVHGSSTSVKDLPTMAAPTRPVPNPFAYRTNIEFRLDKPGAVRLIIYNLLGEELHQQRVDGKLGTNRVPFNAERLGTGMYLYKLEAEGRTFTGRMVVDR